MKRFAWFIMVVVAVFFVSCQPDDINSSTFKGDFNVKISSITRSTVTLSVAPREPEATYICHIYEKGYVDEFTKDEYVIDSVLSDLEGEGFDEGKTKEEYLALVVERGANDNIRFSGLDMNTEYYALIFGVDGANGYAASTELVKVPFKTLVVEKSDLSFDVECSVIDNSVIFDVAPSDSEAYWYLFTVTKEQYDYYVNDEGGYEMSQNYFFEYYLQQQINAYLQGGYSEEQVIEALFHRGNLKLEAKGLKENTVYYYLIAGLILDSEGIVINTDIYMADYTTKSAAQTDLSFRIDVWDVTQLTANVRITPSNNNERYCALIQPWDGETSANELMHKIVNQWGGWMDYMANDKGMVEHTGSNAFTLPAADTDYYVIAFGYNGGITSEAYMKTFRTLPGGSVEEVEFSVSVSNITPYSLNMNIKSSDPTIFFMPGACVKEEYNEAEYIKYEEEAFDYYYTKSQEFNPSITVAEILDQYYYNGSTSVGVSGLMPDMEIMAYIYALDVHTGHVVKTFTFDAVARTESLSVERPAVDLVGYYSGDDEAGTIFDHAAITKGKAITVVKYSNIENVRTLFTTMVEGDCSNPNSYLDTELWSLTTGYWKTCPKGQPYSFYLVDWNVDETALCYARDTEGMMTPMGRLCTRPQADNKSNIEELRTLYLGLKAEKSSVALPASVVIEDAPRRATITAI